MRSLNGSLAGLTNPFLFQKMFAHMKAIGLKEYHCGICTGVTMATIAPERDLQAGRLLPWTCWHWKPPRMKLCPCTRRSINLKETPERFSAQKTPHGRNPSWDIGDTKGVPTGIGGVPPSQRGNLGKAPLGCLPRQNFMPRCRWTYDHFGCHHSRQQESWRGGPMVSEGLSPPGIGHSGYAGGSYRVAALLYLLGVAQGLGGNWAVARGQEAGSAQEATVTQGAAKGVCQLVPKDRHPQWKATLGMHPKGGQTHPVPCDPGGGSPLRTPAQIPIQKWPPRLPTGLVTAWW